MKCCTKPIRRKIFSIQLKIKINWIGHILGRNCLLKQTIEVKIVGRVDWQVDVSSLSIISVKEKKEEAVSGYLVLQEAT
jgi:hypothetical protein